MVAVSLLWAQQSKSPPQTRRDNVQEVIHGITIPDPYRWLEDQKSPETRAWIEGENNYTESILGSLPGREALRQRLTALMKIDAIGMPIERGGRYFFSKRLASQDLFVIYFRKGLRGKDEVLVDPHLMSADHSTSVVLLNVSRDGTWMVYGVRQGGQDEFSVRLFDVDAKRDLSDQLPTGRYFGVSLKPDKTGLFYSRHEPEGPRVYYHALGTDPDSDVEVFGKGYGPEKIIGEKLSEDGRYLLITVLYGSAADRTEIYYQDLAKHKPIQPVVNDLAARFSGSIEGNRLFLRTNWKAPNGRILSADLSNPARDRWREIVPESKSVIESFDAAGGKLFVNYTENASSRVKVFDPNGKPVRDVALPALGSVSGIRGRWGSNEVFYAFTSFHIPATIYRYEAATGGQEIWAQLKVPIQADQFEVKQVWYESKDGTKAPMFLVFTKGIKLDGSSPVLLTGYGGFNVSETPAFSARAAAWVERGGVYALATLRGGGEFGEAWHHAGMLEKKQNVFDDFIAAAQWLIQKGYTSSAKLALIGTSNGGLLVGAALTQCPDLFQAVVCRYPLLDMLRYQKFLVARYWVPEYGSSDDPEQFTYLRAYSPYQNVKPDAKYPAVLIVSGDGDTRVDPLHARKMAALLQASTGSDRPVLLLYDTKSGHSGGRPLNKEIEETTDELSFLLWQLGAQIEKPTE